MPKVVVDSSVIIKWLNQHNEKLIIEAESTYKIGQELNITYYDASFLSVAQQLGASLVTDNIKHQGKSTKVKVIPLKDY